MNRSRPKQVIFRLSEGELQLLQRKVEKSGKSQQEYILKSVLDKQIVNTEDIKELMPELKRIGNNLNQIAKKLNSQGYCDYGLLTENQKELVEIWQLLKQYLRKQA